MKATISIEIEIQENISDLYPNFEFNYSSKQEFLKNQISSLNHNITLEEQMFYKSYHPHFDHSDFKLSDDGYKQRVTKVEIDPVTTQRDLYQIVIIYNNELELLLQHLTEEEMRARYVELCERWYAADSFTEFKNEWTLDDGEAIDMCDSYKTSSHYFDADDRTNVIWEMM